MKIEDLEKALQYFTIAVPENEEQAKAYFWARKGIITLRSMPEDADTNVGGSGWISVKDRMPDEHDSMFARFYGTEKWSGAMFKTCSDLVVVSYNANGQNLISTAITRDGKFRFQTVLAGEVTHWMPLPEPPEVNDHV